MKPPIGPILFVAVFAAANVAQLAAPGEACDKCCGMGTVLRIDHRSPAEGEKFGDTCHVTECSQQSSCMPCQGQGGRNVHGHFQQRQWGGVHEPRLSSMLRFLTACRKARSDRRLLTRGLYVAAFVLAANAVWLALPGLKAQFGSEQTTPYTVVLRELVTAPSGTSRVMAIQTRAARSDGSWLFMLGPAEKGGRVIQFSSGEKVQVNDATRRRSTTSHSLLQVLRAHRSPRASCMANLLGEPFAHDETLGGEEFIAGYRAIRITSRSGSTSWYALDHGCAPIKQRRDFGQGESSEWDLVALAPGEPDPALFAIPADYAEGPVDAARAGVWIGLPGSHGGVSPKAG